ncbi:helix-turn-helix domain-containing protein [Streptomyces kunmingensis]
MERPPDTYGRRDGGTGATTTMTDRGNVDHNPYLDGLAPLLADASATGRRLTRDELDSRRLLGERAAESGARLRPLIAAHVREARTCWPTGTPSPTDVMAAVEQALDAFIEGYERAQRQAMRQEVAARREFIDDLLYGRSDLGQLAQRAERFGLRLSHAHAVAVAQGEVAYDEGDDVPRAVERAMISRFGDREILLTTKDGRLVCIAPGDQSEVLSFFAKHAHVATDGGRVALGRSQPGPSGVVQSYEEALGTLELAERLELDEPVLRAADLLVFPVLTRDRQALVDLVVNVLGPLRDARGGAGPLLATLSAYFDAGCTAAEAARRLSLSVRAFTYRLDRIHKLTGADPSDPTDRYTLQTAVIGARFLDWPDQPI